MPTSTLFLDVLWPLLIFGIPVAAFIGVGRISCPERERIPITEWNHSDLYGNFKQGLRVCSQNSFLARAMQENPGPAMRDSADPKHTEPQ